MTDAGRQWQTHLARAVATEIRRHRARLGLSAQTLSDRCAELGHPMPRSVLANLESGRRDNITLADLLVLGKALGVPPLILVFPVGQTLTSQPLPGVDLPTWAAFKWFNGLDLREDGNPPEVELPMLMWSTEDTLVARWHEITKEINEHLRAAANRADDKVRALHLKLVDRGKELRQQIESEMRALRTRIRDLEAIVRPLPTELAHIDKEEPTK